MCGIAGIWGSPLEARLAAAAHRLRHRGPDDESTWLSERHPLGLAHCRLSIIDLDTGQQPVFNETGDVVTVLNGEIYNYVELRDELAACGHQLQTQSDTEVIVHLYEEHGPELVHRLRGMFALAVWDEREGRLLLARDRVGKKPLYYSTAGGEFIFASEIKGVCALAPARAGALDEQALADYLSWGVIHAPATIYRDIRALEPACWMTVQDGRVTRVERYWQPSLWPKVECDPQEAVDRLDAALDEAVRLRLRSDVPVGAFLSGGIDSGIITAMAAKAQAEKLTTVTVGFEDEAFDERPLARQVAEQYGTVHRELVIRPRVADDLPHIAAAYDQPYGDSSCVPTFYVARAARELFKVVLTGDGGDEVFAGYRRYVAAHCAAQLHRLDNPVMRGLVRCVARLMPAPRRYRSRYAFLRRLLVGMGLTPAQRYWKWAIDVLDEAEVRALLAPASLAFASPYRLAETYGEPWSACGAVDRMLGTDMLGVLPNDLLVKMDIATMASGLEARSPLLDHVLLETVGPWPERLKLGGTQTKPLLRRLARRYLPEAVCTAPKRGFEVPVVQWLQGPLRPVCEDVLLSRGGLVRQYLDRPVLERIIRAPHLRDPGTWGRCMWTLLMLGIWDACVRPRAASTQSS